MLCHGDNYRHAANFCSTQDLTGSANLRPFSKVRRIELGWIWQFNSSYRAIKPEKLYLARKKITAEAHIVAGVRRKNFEFFFFF